MSYDNVDGARRARRPSSRSATRPSKRRSATSSTCKFDEPSAKAIAAFKKGVADDLKAAGYPTKADPAKMNKVDGRSRCCSAGALVTMVYGPIAAMLVELFPTRIRYTSMSLPYHIGNGWFGGLLPTTAFAIVAQHRQHVQRPVVPDHHRGA